MPPNSTSLWWPVSNSERHVLGGFARDGVEDDEFLPTDRFLHPPQGFGQQLGQAGRIEADLVVPRAEPAGEVGRNLQVLVVGAEPGGEGVELLLGCHVARGRQRDRRVEPGAQRHADMVVPPRLASRRGEQPPAEGFGVLAGRAVLDLDGESQVVRRPAAAVLAELQSGAARDRADAREAGGVAGQVPGALEVLDGVAVGRRGDIVDGEERLLLAGEQPPPPDPGEVERPDRPGVAR
jgi:hypothetical protein